MRHLITKKRVLSLALALLLIGGLVGAGFLVIPRPTTRWSFHAGIPPLWFFSPIVSNGLVYTSLSSGLSNSLYALDANSGRVRWVTNIEGFIDDAPVVANGFLYVLADDMTDRDDYTFYALDAASGRIQWSYQHTLLYSPTIANRIAYLNSIDGNLYAFDALSGQQLWSAPVGGGLFSTPLVANNTLYIATEHQGMTTSTVFALDAASGVQKWSVVEATSLLNQLTVANGLLYFAAGFNNAQVWALDASSGKTIWSAQFPGSSGTTPLASPLQVVNGLVYVDYAGFDQGTNNPSVSTLYALDAHTGQQVWSASNVSTEPIIANGKVYIYSGDVYSGGNVSALDARSGRQQWSHPAVFPFEVSQTISPEPPVVTSTIFIVTADGGKEALSALNAVSGSEQWSYQLKDSLSAQPTIMQGIVYVPLFDTLEAIQPPGGPPGFAW